MALLVVEADGASRGNPGPAAYGALVRDGVTGQVLAERAETLGTTTNNVAEYRGLIAGLRAARDLDPDAEVEVRMDSKLVVEQMSGRWQIKHPAMRPLAVEARGILPAQRVRYVWVPREQNKAADRLANAALDGRPPGSMAPAPSAEGPVVDEAEVDVPPRNVLIGWTPDLGEPTRLLALRHGATSHTLTKRFSGSGGDDPGLSDEGREQARRAAELIASREPVEAVLSSPLRRAVESAEAVAAATGLSVRIEKDLREADFGAWDGLTYAEVSERWPRELEQWLASPTVAPPGGESLEDVADRVGSLRARLLARWAGRSVLLVTHVTPVKLLVRDALRAPADAVYRMESAPASLTELHWWPDGTASLRRFNETAHLL